MGDRRRDDVAAPRVFDRHRDAQRHAEIADLPRLGEPADLRDLEVDHVHRLVGHTTHDHVDAIHDLVEHERPVGVPAHGEALLVRHARLLDVHIHVAHGVGHAHGNVLRPPGVGVGNEHVTRLELLGGGVDAFDVRIRVATDLELELRIPLAAVLGDARSHRDGRLLRDGAVQREVVADAAAHERGDGLALPSRSQQAMSMADFTYGCPRMALSIRSLSNPRASGSTPSSCGASSAMPARAPRAYAGRYAGPSGQTSPHPLMPSSVSTATIVASNTETELPPDHL